MIRSLHAAKERVSWASVICKCRQVGHEHIARSTMPQQVYSNGAPHPCATLEASQSMSFCATVKGRTTARHLCKAGREAERQAGNRLTQQTTALVRNAPHTSLSLLPSALAAIHMAIGQPTLRRLSRGG